ncbi:MAG: M48 family metalloprotease [Pseudomonadota bacterium]
MNKAGTSSSLPSLGDNSELASAAERRIGDRIAASIYRDPDYIDDPVLSDYVQGIWQALMAAARARGELHDELQERFAWEVFLIRDRTVNAFALPGGYFGVHLGLISLVSNRDELAAVLGHELSHVTQRHISRLITQQSRQAPWLIGAMILGALAASKNPQAASAAMVGGQALAAQTQLNFSRDMEREADRVGLGVMTDAGFESRGAGTMFEKLQQASRLTDNGAFPYLRSHPLSTERIAEVQARLQLVSQQTPASASDVDQAAKNRFLHMMMAARARVLVDPGVDLLRPMVAQAQLAMNASGVPATPPVPDARAAGVLYAGALASAKLRDFAQAQAMTARLQALAAGNADASNVAELLSLEIDLLAGKVPAAAAGMDINRPVHRADVLLRSRALLSAGRARDVSGRLQTWVSAHPGDALAWQLLAIAYGNQNQHVRAIRADAEARFAQLDYAGALDRLRAAQDMMRSNPASADFMEGSIIDTRARQVDLLLKEQALQDKLDR